MRSLILAILMFAMPASAHELWIEPEQFQVAADTNLRGNLVNGENFQGVSLAYLPRNFNRFVMVRGGEFTNVNGRIGDRPALDMEPLGDGLHVVAYISNPSVISYETWDKFQAFVDHKDLGDALGAHRDRGLPEVDFTEVYIRYSKSLIGVGPSDGSDRALGMETEIIALSNPYTADLNGMMPLQLLYQRQPRSNEQIEIFEKSGDGDVNVFLVRTDEDGVAQVPVKAAHIYMADAVVLREPSEALAASSGAVWETLWANITWGMP